MHGKLQLMGKEVIMTYLMALTWQLKLEPDTVRHVEAKSRCRACFVLSCVQTTRAQTAAPARVPP
jgi:hypothetical protein